MKTLFTIILLIAYSLPLNATIHYVSHNGSNIPPYLTWGTAADSIQSAINVCAPGDTVLVANGVYYENLIIDSMLTLIGSSMDSTVIDGRGLGDYTIVFNASGSIENFNIYGKGIGASGTRVIRSMTLYTLIEIRDCKLSEAGVGVSMVGGDIIADNLLIKNTTRGFNLFGESDNYISNCIIILDNQNSQGVNIGFAPDVNSYITNNILLFAGSNNDLTYGIALGAPREVHISNNLISGFSNNIFTDDPSDTVYIKNNVLIHQFSFSPGPASILASGDWLSVSNNIFSSNKKGIDGDALVKSNYNLFWDNLTDLEGLVYGDSDRVANPMFIKDTLPNPQLDFDYHLQAYSPGIDKGDPNILDVDGTRSDIGMFGGPYGETYTYQNLAPRAPVNLSALVDSGEVTLTWNRNSEADTAYYNVYKDTTENFIISPAKLVGSPSDTFFTETIPQQIESVYYKITAVDNEGNESGPSEEVKINITSVDEYIPIVKDYYLYQNYPNPFNPTTKIGYKLKERSYVKLIVYDIKGELVQVLVNKEQEAGYYDVEFTGKNLSTGIYLYRIEIIGKGNLPDGKAGIPKFSDMKKMILVK